MIDRISPPLQKKIQATRCVGKLEGVPKTKISIIARHMIPAVRGRPIVTFVHLLCHD